MFSHPSLTCLNGLLEWNFKTSFDIQLPSSQFADFILLPFAAAAAAIDCSQHNNSRATCFNSDSIFSLSRIIIRCRIYICLCKTPLSTSTQQPTTWWWNFKIVVSSSLYDLWLIINLSLFISTAENECGIMIEWDTKNMTGQRGCERFTLPNERATWPNVCSSSLAFHFFPRARNNHSRKFISCIVKFARQNSESPWSDENVSISHVWEIKGTVRRLRWNASYEPSNKVSESLTFSHSEPSPLSLHFIINNSRTVWIE